MREKVGVFVKLHKENFDFLKSRNINRQALFNQLIEKMRMESEK